MVGRASGIEGDSAETLPDPASPLSSSRPACRKGRIVEEFTAGAADETTIMDAAVL